MDDSSNRPEYGRDASKRRAQKSRPGTPSPSVGNSGSRRGVYKDQLDNIACKLDTFNVFQQQRAEIRKSKEARDALKQRRDDMKFLAQPIDHLSGEELELMLETREEIKKKYYKH